jgi:nucleoid-associated protein YgaU
MSSRYRSSLVLEYVTTDFSTGTTTTLEYRGPRRSISASYPSVQIMQYRGEDWDEMAFKEYGGEEVWFVIAEYNKIMFPWAISSGEILEIPPKFVAIDYMMG